MTAKWGLEKLLNAGRVTRACQWLLKKNPKKPTNNNTKTQILTNYSASCMQMRRLECVSRGFFFILSVLI